MFPAFISISVPVSFPEFRLQDNRESYARKSFWDNPAKKIFCRNLLNFPNFFIHVRFFCNEKSFFKSGTSIAKHSKNSDIFFRTCLALTVFASKISWNCISVTYNLCSFRRKRAFPRPLAARWIKEKLILIWFCTFVLVFCFFQKVCLRGKRDQNPNSVVLFRRIFNCHGKFVVSFIQRPIPPLFAVSDKRHEITQKYFLTECIYSRYRILWPRRFDFQVCDLRE